MAQPEYKDIRDGDWQNLRYAIRRCNERLSDLEGYGGEKTRYANLKMDGNRLRNGPPDQQTAEGDEFITKDYLKSYEAMEIINPGEIRGITNSGGTGGTTSVSTYDSPRIYTDFTDAGRWHPIGAASNGANMQVATSGVTLSGIKNYGNPNQGDLFSGVVSSGRIYPDAATGTLSFKCTFDNYITATDVPKNSQFLHGMMVLVNYPGCIGTGSKGIFGGVGFSEDNLERPFIMSEYANGVPMSVIIAKSTHFTIENMGWWSVTFTFAGFTRYGDQYRTYSITSMLVDGGASITPESVALPFLLDSNRPKGMGAILGGVRIALGCWPQNNSSVGSARLVSFELINGNMYW